MQLRLWLGWRRDLGIIGQSTNRVRDLVESDHWAPIRPSEGFVLHSAERRCLVGLTAAGELTERTRPSQCTEGGLQVSVEMRIMPRI